MRKWTKQEDDLLRKKPPISIKRLAYLLKRSQDSIRSRLISLGIKRQRCWSEKEDAFLLKNYGFLPITMIAKKLKRTPAAVTSRAVVLGLSRRKEALSINQVFKCDEVFTMQELRTLLKVPRSTLRDCIDRMLLSKQIEKLKLKGLPILYGHPSAIKRLKRKWRCLK